LAAERDASDAVSQAFSARIASQRKMIFERPSPLAIFVEKFFRRNRGSVRDCNRYWAGHCENTADAGIPDILNRLYPVR
jgi:hypothetical protein